MYLIRDVPRTVFLTSVILVALSIILMVGFIFLTAAPVISKEGIGFVFGTVWDYETHTYDMWIFLVNTILLTLLTIVIACPIGLLTAIYLSEWAPPSVERVMRPAIELLVGIPSVVFGIFGYFILRSFFVDDLNPFLITFFGWIPFIGHNIGTGESMLLAATILTIMVLPTIVALSQEAIKAVPAEFREGSFALGATKWETIRFVVLPAALSGIITSVVIAIMRAMGETMAVVMVIGNSPQIPGSILDMGYVMTSKILNDIGYYIVDQEPRSALFGLAAAIFLIEIVMVGIIRYVSNRMREG
jgi:phosphate transport system permease protein